MADAGERRGSDLPRQRVTTFPKVVTALFFTVAVAIAIYAFFFWP